MVAKPAHKYKLGGASALAGDGFARRQCTDAVRRSIRLPPAAATHATSPAVAHSTDLHGYAGAFYVQPESHAAGVRPWHDSPILSL